MSYATEFAVSEVDCGTCRLMTCPGARWGLVTSLNTCNLVDLVVDLLMRATVISLYNEQYIRVPDQPGCDLTQATALTRALSPR